MLSLPTESSVFVLKGHKMLSLPTEPSVFAHDAPCLVIKFRILPKIEEISKWSREVNCQPVQSAPLSCYVDTRHGKYSNKQ